MILDKFSTVTKQAYFGRKCAIRPIFTSVQKRRQDLKNGKVDWRLFYVAKQPDIR